VKAPHHGSIHYILARGRDLEGQKNILKIKTKTPVEVEMNKYVPPLNRSREVSAEVHHCRCRNAAVLYRLQESRGCPDI